MEALKLKIFDVLTEKTPVSEFENWLYNSEEFMSQINMNTFYFDVISINYKSDNWRKQLDNLTKEKYNEDFMILYEIKKSCLELSNSKKPEEAFSVLSKLLIDFDYDTDYDILWKFYSVHEYFETFEGSMFNKNELLEEARFYAKQVIELTQNCISFKETNEVLIEDLKLFKTARKEQKTSLKQKIFAFFKKI